MRSRPQNKIENLVITVAYGCSWLFSTLNLVFNSKSYSPLSLGFSIAANSLWGAVAAHNFYVAIRDVTHECRHPEAEAEASDCLSEAVHTELSSTGFVLSSMCYLIPDVVEIQPQVKAIAYAAGAAGWHCQAWHSLLLARTDENGRAAGIPVPMHRVANEAVLTLAAVGFIIGNSLNNRPLSLVSNSLWISASGYMTLQRLIHICRQYYSRDAEVQQPAAQNDARVVDITDTPEADAAPDNAQPALAFK